MSNLSHNLNKPEYSDKHLMLNAKIREAWSRLSDDDVKLYDDGSREQFIARLKEKQNISKEEGEKRLQEIEKSCATACASE